MSNRLTRRGFFLSSVAGAVAVILPTTVANAVEMNTMSNLEDFIPIIPLSSDETTNYMNQKALGRWSEAVREAYEQGSYIYDNPGAEPCSGDYRATVCTKVVTKWNIPCMILFNVIFAVAPGGDIGEVFRIDSYAQSSGPTVHYDRGWFIRKGNKQEIAAFFVTDVTWDPGIYPAQTETIATYVEFSSESQHWLC